MANFWKRSELEQVGKKLLIVLGWNQPWLHIN